MTQFDLFFVNIGDQLVSSRPIEWVGETPTRFVTTCPHCSQLVDFVVSQLVDLGGEHKHIKCVSCGVGTASSPEPTPEPPATAGTVLPFNPFTDPIADKSIDTTNFKT